MEKNDIEHFDIKPENILLTEDKDLTFKLIDFGMVQKWNSLEAIKDNF